MVELSEEQIKALQAKLQQIAGLLPEEQNKKAMEMLSPEEIEFLKSQQQGGGQCIFCRIAKGEVPAKTIYEDANFLAFLDINPASPGHTLFITKEHVQILPQLSDELGAEALNIIKKLATAVFEGTNAQGINIMQNNGSVAGQAVPHIHFHIIPRFEDDKLKLDWDPIKLSDEQFNEVQKRISEKAKDIGKKVVYDMSGKMIEEKKTKKEEPKKPEEMPRVRRRRA